MRLGEPTVEASRPRHVRLHPLPTPVRLLLLLVLALAHPAGAEPQSAEVAPGGIVRWPGEAIEKCGLANRQWSPMGDACWYPVDLAAEGSIEVERWRGGDRETRRVDIAAYPYDEQHITLKDDTHVNLSPENVERANRESARIGALWSLESEPRFSLPISPPLASLPAGGRFGARRVINGQPRNPHTGVDYAADSGTNVLAVAPGEVVLAEEHFFAGNSIFIDHGAGLISMYFHLSEIGVEKGDQVESGQVIGEVGATGRATGPHLHFGMRWHGSKIDPSLLLASPAQIESLR